MRRAFDLTSYKSETASLWKEFREACIRASTFELMRATLANSKAERDHSLLAYAAVRVYLETVRAQLHAGGNNPHGCTWARYRLTNPATFVSAHSAYSRMFSGILRRVFIRKMKWRAGVLHVQFGVVTKASWFSRFLAAHDGFERTPFWRIAVTWTPMLTRESHDFRGWRDV